MRIGRQRLLLAWVVAVAAPGMICGGCTGVDPDAQTLAQNGSDVSDVTARVSGLAASFGLGAGATFDPAAFAATKTLYTPSGCAVPQQGGDDSLTMTFEDGCSGPWGLQHLSGSVKVEPPPKGEQGLSLKATDLKVGRASVTFDATATVAQSGPMRTLTWNATVTGTTARNLAFQTSGTWTLEWTLGGTCVDINGTLAATAAGSSLSITASGLERCDADCPTAGTILIKSASISDSISFNGSDVAAFTTSSGTSDIQLACGL
jgi:hypothetical protein